MITPEPRLDVIGTRGPSFQRDLITLILLGLFGPPITTMAFQLNGMVNLSFAQLLT